MTSLIFNIDEIVRAPPGASGRSRNPANLINRQL
jgi:hypothetical protein